MALMAVNKIKTKGIDAESASRKEIVWDAGYRNTAWRLSRAKGPHTVIIAVRSRLRCVEKQSKSSQYPRRRHGVVGSGSRLPIISATIIFRPHLGGTAQPTKTLPVVGA